MDSAWFPNSFFSQKYCLESFLQRFNLKFSIFLHYFKKNGFFYPFSGIRSDWNWQKMLLVLTCLENQSNFSSVLPASSSLQRINRQRFTLSRRFIPENHAICFLQYTWSADWPYMAKALLLLNYPIFQSRRFCRQHFSVRLSKYQLKFLFFWVFPRWNNFWLFPLDWTVDKLNMQKKFK